MNFSQLQFSCDLLLLLLFCNHLICDLSCYIIYKVYVFNYAGLSPEVLPFSLEKVFVCRLKESDFYVLIFLFPRQIAKSPQPIAGCSNQPAQIIGSLSSVLLSV